MVLACLFVTTRLEETAGYELTDVQHLSQLLSRFPPPSSPRSFKYPAPSENRHERVHSQAWNLSVPKLGIHDNSWDHT